MQNLPSDIFVQVSEGNEKAFEQVFRAFYPALCGYARQFMGDTDAAEEVVQEVFFKIWEKREGLEIQTSVKAYLYRAVHNHCLNHFKHLKVRDQYKTHVEHTATRDQETDPAEAAELNEKIEKAIDQLPEQCGRIFKMSRFEEMKYKEIADKLDISVKTVEAQMGKALKLMRESLSEYIGVVLYFVIKIFF